MKKKIKFLYFFYSFLHILNKIIFFSSWMPLKIAVKDLCLKTKLDDVERRGKFLSPRFD